MRSLPPGANSPRSVSSLCAACLLLVGTSVWAQVKPAVETTVESSPVSVTADVYRTHDYVERGLRIFAGTDPVMVTELRLTRQVGPVALTGAFWHGGTHQGLEGAALATLECPSLEAATTVGENVEIAGTIATCVEGRHGAHDSNDIQVKASRSTSLGFGVSLAPTVTLAVDPATRLGYASAALAARWEVAGVSLASTVSAGAGNSSSAGPALQDLTAGLEARWSVTEAMQLRAFATSTISPLAAEWGQSPVQGYAGLGVSLSM